MLTCPQPFLEHKVYQLDYSRAVGEYRVLEHFLPKVLISYLLVAAHKQDADPARYRIAGDAQSPIGDAPEQDECRGHGRMAAGGWGAPCGVERWEWARTCAPACLSNGEWAVQDRLGVR